MENQKKPIDRSAVLMAALGVLLLAVCVVSFFFDGLMYLAGLVCGALGILLLLLAVLHSRAFHQE